MDRHEEKEGRREKERLVARFSVETYPSFVFTPLAAAALILQ